MVVTRRRRSVDRAFRGPAPASRPALPPPPAPVGDPVGGVVVFDRSGSLLHADRGAAALLDASPGLAARLGQLALLHAGGAPGRPDDQSVPLPDGGAVRLLLFPILSDVGELFGMLSITPPPGVVPPAQLSPREAEIVELVRRGHPVPTVARHLGLSRDTVRWHLRNVRDKGVKVELP